MPFRSHIPRILTAAPLVLALAAPAHGQETFARLAEKSLAEMNAEKWQDALATLDLILTQYGQDDPMRAYGPQFGAIYFRKGLCELKLAKWKDAAASFATCYQAFPNPPGGTPNGNVNPFQKRALLKWGEAAMGQGEWELALAQFRKFLDERDKTADSYPAGAFHINVAICNYKLGRIAPGSLNLEIAIANKENFPTPDEGIVAGFEAFAGTAIRAGNEPVILEFIRRNRGGITFEPCDMSVFAGTYMGLGAAAMAADMPAAALGIYQLVPSTESMIDDVRARIALMGPLPEVPGADGPVTKKSLQERLSALEGDLRGPGAAEIVKLAAVALIHEKVGNLRGAYSAFRQLVLYFPDAAKREDYLFNAIRLGILAGEPDTAISEYTTALVAEFPSSANAPAAKEMMVSSLFEAGKYQEARKLAEETLAPLKEGAGGHDLCLYVVGASSFHLGDHARAQAVLDEHAAKYPKSRFARETLFLRASNHVKLREWDDAVILLDAFLSIHPDPAGNPYLPFALYDRALARSAEDDKTGALADLKRAAADFPEAPIAGRVLLLQGDVEDALGKPDEAKKSYLKGLELAGARGDRPTADEALASLVSLLAAKSPKEAASYADRYWKEHAEGSAHDPEVAVFQLRPLAAQKRGDEALARLREVILLLAEKDRGYRLDQCIAAYAKAYLADHDAAALRKHFDAFPGLKPDDKGTRALLRMEVINAYEAAAAKATDDTARLAARTTIVELFQELKTSINAKDLPTPILLKLADHLRSTTSAPREALPFYEEAISRQEPAYRFAALFGRGDTWSRSGAPEELQKGIDDFAKILADSRSRAEREYSLFRIVGTLVSKGDFPEAIRRAKEYEDPASRFFRYRTEVSLLVAQALRESGDTDGAISAYSSVWAGDGAPDRFSALALKSWISLLWDRNHGDDRRTAIRNATRYLDVTAGRVETLSPDELVLRREIEKMVRDAANDPAMQ